ncbi:hypothetical protein ALC62_06173 [Cyphomyrmex costatus]|uniref:Uncharacterized protein n=1 Tax=Cyphomyrmex costatus TaxID=456900 RepID=A0A195CQQ6_9HYME|nr:hypothetical protein ALC62_06173 [Cyphomyrmex costatus]
MYARTCERAQTSTVTTPRSESTEANFSRDLALIRGGSPLDHEERCLIDRLSDFSKVTMASWDKY